jgi:hypothetical protein
MLPVGVAGASGPDPVGPYQTTLGVIVEEMAHESASAVIARMSDPFARLER